MRRTHLKDQLEDLVDRTGRVEDMLDVLAGIYRERARHPEYIELRDDMLATAHVLHEASEAVAAIFGEEDEEALEHQAERAAWQARHEEGRGNPAERLAYARERPDGPGPDRLRIVPVDGERVRRDVDVDFTMGGNPSRYGYVPQGELWIEDNLSIPDAISTIVHESVEHRLMKHDGLSYDDAHEAANGIDAELRHAVDHAMQRAPGRGNPRANPRRRR